MTLSEILRRAHQPVGVTATAPFAEAWAAGVLFVGGWEFGIDDVPGDYEIVAAHPERMRRLRVPTDIHQEFANLLTPGKTEAYELTESHVRAVIAVTDGKHRPRFEQERVQPDVMLSFLTRYGPLTDSFMRAGHDPDEERERCGDRDARGLEWAYKFMEPLRAVAEIFELSRSQPDRALELAWLLLDEAPRFTLLKVIATNTFVGMLEGHDMTRCENPSCRRYFQHVRIDQQGCSSSCASVIRQRRKRERDRSRKRKSTKGGRNG